MSPYDAVSQPATRTRQVTLRRPGTGSRVAVSQPRQYAVATQRKPPDDEEEEEDEEDMPPMLEAQEDPHPKEEARQWGQFSGGGASASGKRKAGAEMVYMTEDGRQVVTRGMVNEHGWPADGQYEVIDESLLVEAEDGTLMVPEDAIRPAPRTRPARRNLEPPDLRTVEFNFLDNKNICCGLCGEIVPYDTLVNEHLPLNHPEVLGDGEMTMEEIPYEEWLREKLHNEKRAIESGFQVSSAGDSGRMPLYIGQHTRTHRRVSQIRVNPTDMSLEQLDAALKKKLAEKMNKQVPVTLVDKQHARCGLCNAVVSLNKKFEVVHLIRHFNAWHPSTHDCSNSWRNAKPTRADTKVLSQQDFTVIDANNATAPDNLQCIWCGMFMDGETLAIHFAEIHPSEIEVPKCNLCLQELILNARIQEKYGEDLRIVVPDEHHLKCMKYNALFTSEAALERGIDRRLNRLVGGDNDEELDVNDEVDEFEDGVLEPFSNSRLSLGRSKKPKRQFIMPALRQAAPMHSQFVEPVSESHWRCKKCGDDILAAVISAGAIRHYRTKHPSMLDDMQYELCRARLERVSDGCMEFVHPQLIECLLCNMTYNLHKAFNMCRAIRHLKAKHPNLMPEYGAANASVASSTSAGELGSTKKSGTTAPPAVPLTKVKEARRPPNVTETRMEVQTVDNLEQLKELYGVDVSQMQTVTGADGETVYVLMPDGEEIDPDTAEKLVQALEKNAGEDEGTGSEAKGPDEQGDKPSAEAASTSLSAEEPMPEPFESAE